MRKKGIPVIVGKIDVRGEALIKLRGRGPFTAQHLDTIAEKSCVLKNVRAKYNRQFSMDRRFT